MARIMNSHQAHSYRSTRSVVQNTCVGLGIFFILTGLIGLIMPGFMGMHLSMSHSLIHIVSGALALWAGFADESRRAYTFSVVFGSLYGLLGIAGFIIGVPGYPGVGHMAADQYLWRVIPNILELGTIDHTVHLILSAAFLLAAYNWKKRFEDSGRSKVDVQRRADLMGRETFRSNSSNSEIDRTTNFEGKR
jgi:hypothetical protein